MFESVFQCARDESYWFSEKSKRVWKRIALKTRVK